MFLVYFISYRFSCTISCNRHKNSVKAVEKVLSASRFRDEETETQDTRAGNGSVRLKSNSSVICPVSSLLCTRRALPGKWFLLLREQGRNT